MDETDQIDGASATRARWRRRIRELLGVRSQAELRQVATKGVDLMARRLNPGRPHAVRLNYPPSARRGPRYGYGRPQHVALAEGIGAHRDTYRRELEAIITLSDDLARIPLSDPAPGEPCWLNAWLPPLDTASLYGYLRRLSPRRYIEVGSGHSTAVARRAQRDGSLPTAITSIDPSPRREVDRLCDDVIRQPLESIDLHPFFSLAAGDLVFFDGSHRVFTNSDVVAFYLDVLPNLPEGVVVGIHDILWPDDYLPEWTDYWFSEQYLLAAYLLAGAPFIEPLLACRYAGEDPALRAILTPLWDRLAVPDGARGGSAFWLRVQRRA